MTEIKDLRYIKVEEALRTALLELLEHKRLEDVSVSEICSLARCSRNAFYGHYAGRDELCAAMLDEFAETVRQACAAENVRLLSGEINSDGIADSGIMAFRKHEQLLRVLLKSDSGVFASKLKDILLDVTSSSLEKLTGAPLDVRARLANAYAAGGVVALVVRWFQEDIPFDEVKHTFAVMQIPVSETLRRTVGILTAEEALQARVAELED